jgi:uncharacterized repeat protein (TIGR01451 family)
VVCTITNTARTGGLAVTKSAPPVAHDGDSIVYVIQVSNTGAVPLHNVAVAESIGSTGSTCQSGPVLAGGDNGDGILDTTETWIYHCTYTVQHADEDATHHIVNVATVTATSASGHGVGPVEASATTLITHPAIALLKSGPASAVAGTSVAYSLRVTNAGDTSFAESTVKVADTKCRSGSLKLYSKHSDTSPGSLDPGDVWTYSCVVKTTAGDTAVNNTATARATDQFGTAVTAEDSAETRLTPGGPFTAKLTGLTGCVYRSFDASVRGQGIAKVIFLLDGKRVKRVANTRQAARVRIRLRINMARLRAGMTHRLIAKVTFAAGAAPKSKTLRLSFRLCPKQLVSPGFTG